MRLRHLLCLLPVITLACADAVPTAPAHLNEVDRLETSLDAAAMADSTGSGRELTATFANLPATHDGKTAFTFELSFSEEPSGLSYKTVRDSLFHVTNGRIRNARRVTTGSNLAFVVTVRPSKASDISLTVRGTTDCEAAHAVCTADGRMLAGGASATVSVTDVITMTVADAEVVEAEGATLDFTVTLSRAAERRIQVWYRAYDGTATAGTDYEAVRSSFTLEPGETAKTIPVVVLDDEQEEDSETVKFWLWGVRGISASQITDAHAVGTIHDSRPSPDLEVGASVDDSSPETGGSFTLSATVTNAGDSASTATTLRYYRSSDATISSSDTEVGTDAVGALAAAGTSDQSVDLTAPSTAGIYYYGACVDAVAGEADTSNNCSASVQVEVEDPRRGSPDLVMSDLGSGRNDVANSAAAAAATPAPRGTRQGPPVAGDIITATMPGVYAARQDVIIVVGTVAPGDTALTLSVTVQNHGDGNAPATTMRFYRSLDATISASDTEIDSVAVKALAPSESASGTSALTAPSTPGTYYYGACVDPVDAESDTTNNCIGAIKLAVAHESDLEVGASVDDTSLHTGGSFTLSATVTNSGDGASGTTTLRYYRSSDATISSSDTEVGTGSVGALAAAGTSEQSVDLTAPSSAGTYYYGACVDPVDHEADTTNNCSAGVEVQVSQPSGHD